MKALKVTEGAAPGTDSELDPETLREIAKDMPLSFELFASPKFWEQKYTTELSIYVKIGLLPSKGEAVRLIKNDGAYLNNLRIGDTDFLISEKSLIGGEFLVFGSGKKKKMLVKVKKSD